MVLRCVSLFLQTLSYRIIVKKMVFGSSEYAAGVNGIRNTEIMEIVGEGDAFIGTSSSFGGMS